MEGKKFKLGSSEVGLIFGLTAFRYWCEETGQPLEVLDQVLMDDKMDNVIRNNYWAIFILCGMRVFNRVNKDEKYQQEIPTIEEVEYLIDVTPQPVFNKVFDYYLDSSYVGKTMREHYGLVEVSDKEEKKDEIKKKRTQSAK